MAHFRKKPIVIEAIQWQPGFQGDVPKWISAALDSPCAPGGRLKTGKILRITNDLHVGTREGTMIAEVGDWVIRGIKGEIYPCKPDIFEATYEPVEMK